MSAPRDYGTYRDWRVDVLDVSFLNKDLPRLEAKLLHLKFGQRLATFELFNLSSHRERNVDQMEARIVSGR